MALHNIALQYITKYDTLNYTININTKVAIQKKYVRSTHLTRVQSPKVEPTSY